VDKEKVCEAGLRDGELLSGVKSGLVLAKGRGGTGKVTSPPVGTRVTSGGLFSGVVGGSVAKNGMRKRGGSGNRPRSSSSVRKGATHLAWEEVGPARSPALL